VQAQLKDSTATLIERKRRAGDRSFVTPIPAKTANHAELPGMYKLKSTTWWRSGPMKKFVMVFQSRLVYLDDY
jgi:hypothetical protein